MKFAELTIFVKRWNIFSTNFKNCFTFFLNWWSKGQYIYYIVISCLTAYPCQCTGLSGRQPDISIDRFMRVPWLQFLLLSATIFWALLFHCFFLKFVIYLVCESPSTPRQDARFIVSSSLWIFIVIQYNYFRWKPQLQHAYIFLHYSPRAILWMTGLNHWF